MSSNAGQSLSQPAADSSCCGTQNSLFAKRSQNFDHCHSFLLASSATGGARKRPPFHKGAFGTGDADCRVASLLAMTVLNLCHSEEAQRADVGIRPFLRWTGVRAAVRKTRGTARRGRRPLRKGEKAQSTTQASRRAAKRSRPRGRGMGGNRRKGHPKRGTASATAGAALSEAESAGIAAGQIQSLPDK